MQPSVTNRSETELEGTVTGVAEEVEHCVLGSLWIEFDAMAAVGREEALTVAC